MLQANTTKEGLIYLNMLRVNSGLIPLKENTTLSKAAKSHAKYLILNQHNGHYEEKGKYAYTGKTPSERVVKAGYPSRVTMENLSLNTKTQKKSIDNLFSAIYHRFVFLNLEKDEIGLGDYQTKKKRRIKRAYVYDLASSSISNLCNREHTIGNGQYYMKGVCNMSEKKIPRVLFREKKSLISLQNDAIILYPYAGQKEVYPAFYNESPDPLPNYEVSGFPISVQFNPSVYQNVKLKLFKLYDDRGNEIKNTKILQANNDINHLFTKLEFALMPLARLEYAKRYKIVFEALADGNKVKKVWEFETLRLQYHFFRIVKDKVTLRVKSGESIVLYMVASNPNDLLKSYRASGGIKAEFLDQNTLKVTFPKRKSSAKARLTFSNNKKISFIIE